MSVVIPAIDLRDGRCVRLVQGRLDEETVYSDDPAAVARAFAEAGAKRLHVVDLDGAFDGLPRNLEAVRSIVQAVDVPVQMGGGMRTLDAVERVLEIGVRWAILGTVAIENPELVAEACRRWPGRIIVGIDARDGRAAVRGWTEGTSEDAVELALRMKQLGVEEIVFTDIAKDGMMQGPNVRALEHMATQTGLHVIASGGVTQARDVSDVAAIEGVSGIIIGKALYEGTLTVPRALQAAERGGSGGDSDFRRIVVCLDIADGRVVKGVQFANMKDVGDPVELAARYEIEGADELTVLNIGAGAGNESAWLNLVGRMADSLTIPLVVGGGIDSVEYARQLVEAGADKLSVSSAAVRRPELIGELAAELGAERIVLAVDCRRHATGSGWEVVIDGGRTATGIDVLEWVERMAGAGAGEIVLNSIDADGTKRGYDHELNRAVTERVSVPVTASGGVGELAHLRDGFVEGGVDAVLAASIFHFGTVTVAEAKQYLHAAGVPVRLAAPERRTMQDGHIGS